MAGNSIQVERLDAGKIVTETFHPRLEPYIAIYHGASWCPPCQAFSPHLSEFYHSANKKNFQLLMMNYDQSEGNMQAYMRQHNMEFPAAMRGWDVDGWNITTGPGIPNLIIIETATGKIVSSSYNGGSYVGCDVPLGVLRNIITQGHP